MQERRRKKRSENPFNLSFDWGSTRSCSHRSSLLAIPPQLPNLGNHCFITPVICHNSPASLLLTTKIRQLYYSILVVQSQHRTIEAKIRAAEDLQGERGQQVKYGSAREGGFIWNKDTLLEG